MKILTLVLLCGPLAHTQIRTIQPQETLANLPAQKIGPRDLIAIQVYDSPELTSAIRVGAELPTVLEDAAAEYDLMILDSPPLLGFPEPLQMAASMDGVLVVALAGCTNRKALTSTVNTLKRLRTNIVGVVLNEVRADLSENYYYQYSPTYYKHYQNVEVESEG